MQMLFEFVPCCHRDTKEVKGNSFVVLKAFKTCTQAKINSILLEAVSLIIRTPP